MRDTKGWTREHGAFVAVSALALTLLGLRMTAAVGSGGGYVFSDIAIDQQEGVPDAPGAADDVTIRYSTAWTGDSFPGWRNCSIRVLAQDGSTMAVKHIELIDLTPEPSEKRTEVPIHGTESGRRPASATAACAPGRNDDPEGHWEFEHVRVTRDPTTTGDLRTFQMTFDDRWVGAGTPGVQACTVKAYDAVGRAMFAYPFSFLDSQRVSRGLSMRIVTDSPVVGEPRAADVSCGPIS